MKKKVFKSLIFMTIAIVVVAVAVTVLLVVLNKPKVSDVLLDTKTVQKEFVQGEDFNYDGLKVYARYEDGSKKEVTAYTVDSSTFDSEKAASYTITVSYQNHFKTYEVKALSKIVETLSIENQPKFFIGQTLQASDLVVKANYNNGTSAVVTNYTVNNFDSSIEGEVNAKILYQGVSLEFSATVLSNNAYIDYIVEGMCNIQNIESFSRNYLTGGKLSISNDKLYSEVNFKQTIIENNTIYIFDKKTNGKVKMSMTVEEYFNEMLNESSVEYVFDSTKSIATNDYHFSAIEMGIVLKSYTNLKFEYNEGKITLSYETQGEKGSIVINGGLVEKVEITTDTETNIISYVFNEEITLPEYNPKDYKLVI